MSRMTRLNWFARPWQYNLWMWTQRTRHINLSVCVLYHLNHCKFNEKTKVVGQFLPGVDMLGRNKSTASVSQLRSGLVSFAGVATVTQFSAARKVVWQLSLQWWSWMVSDITIETTTVRKPMTGLPSFKARQNIQSKHPPAPPPHLIEFA